MNSEGASDFDPSADLPSVELHDRLGALVARDRQLVEELLEDAASDVQREVLCRTLLAGHTVKELHAFADEIRGQDDEALVNACSLPETGQTVQLPIVDRLRAEADPLFAFRANGHSLTPNDSAPAAPTPSGARPPASPAPSFQAESSTTRGRANRFIELGGSPGQPVVRKARPGLLLQELFEEVGRALGVTYEEQLVDGGKLTLAKALEQAVEALRRGWPVPLVVGPGPAVHERYVLLLQVQQSEASVAVQIHDPLNQETVWANLTDLRAGTELPLADKTLRRVTAIALPR